MDHGPSRAREVTAAAELGSFPDLNPLSFVLDCPDVPALGRLILLHALRSKQVGSKNHIGMILKSGDWQWHDLAVPTIQFPCSSLQDVLPRVSDRSFRNDSLSQFQTTTAEHMIPAHQSSMQKRNYPVEYFLFPLRSSLPSSAATKVLSYSI